MGLHFWLVMLAGMLLALVISTIVRAVLARSIRGVGSPKPAGAPKSPSDRDRDSPYGHRFRDKMRVLMPDGSVVSDSREALAHVSRHGLAGSGVVCPECQRLVAKAGEWDKVTSTPYGEAICCLACKLMLLASPDDDIDPVRPGQKYDEAIYHKFARPVGTKRPRQRTLARDPVVGDWVAIRDFVWTKPDGSTQDLDRGEGRVTAIADGRATLTLVQGMGDSVTVNVPLDLIRPMASDTLTKGDRVTIVRGAGAGRIGVVQGAKQADITIALTNPDDELTLPIEHLEKIHE
jgi:hypothetical protein